MILRTYLVAEVYELSADNFKTRISEAYHTLNSFSWVHQSLMAGLETAWICGRLVAGPETP